MLNRPLTLSHWGFPQFRVCFLPGPFWRRSQNLQLGFLSASFLQPFAEPLTHCNLKLKQNTPMKYIFAPRIFVRVKKAAVSCNRQIGTGGVFFWRPCFFWWLFLWVAGVAWNCATFASCGRKKLELLTSSGFCNPTLPLGLRVLQPNTPLRA